MRFRKSKNNLKSLIKYILNSLETECCINRATIEKPKQKQKFSKSKKETEVKKNSLHLFKIKLICKLI